MSLKERITDDMKAAMRAKDAERLTTIRMLLAACKQREVDERIELDDAAGHRIGVVWSGGELPATATDITQLGGWRAYLAERSAAAAGQETRR